MIFEHNISKMWSDSDTLYIEKDVDTLVKISGAEVENIKKILSVFTDKTKLSSECIENDFNDVENAEQYIKWLVDNKLIYQADIAAEQLLNYSITIISDSNEIKEKLEKLISSKNIKNITVSDNEQVENRIVILLLTDFPDYEKLKVLSEKYYRENIPIFNFEINQTNLTIGPVFDPAKFTASLQCYLKRRVVNSKNASLFVEFIKADKNVQFVKEKKDFPYLDICFELIIGEIARYISFNGKFSFHILNKAITIDFINYSVESSYVLKDPKSPLFNHSVYVPFNK